MSVEMVLSSSGSEPISVSRNVEKSFRNFPRLGADPELIDLEEFKTWILFEDEHVIVLDKPGWVVCHPSKNGPLSSLVGAFKVYSGLETLHLVSRLDRETSGVVIIAKHKQRARELQMAFERRRVEKSYWAILEGEMEGPIEVNQHLAKDLNSTVAAKVTVRKSNSSKSAQTEFEPIISKNGYTLAKVKPITGRKHQIRAHALWLGHPVIGDKIYGADDTLFLEFIEHGWTERLQQHLPMRRQALHAADVLIAEEYHYQSPLAWDMVQFCEAVMGVRF